MLISKARVQSASRQPQPKHGDRGSKLPDLEDLLQRRDYVGALTLLSAQCRGGAGSNAAAVGGQQDAQQSQEWLAYAHFHYSEHDKALKIYRQLLSGPDPDPTHHTYAAACLFHMGDYAAAEAAAAEGPRSQLQARILFHCAHKRGDESALMARHGELSEGVEDELSLAAVHYQRGHYQEATDTYKRLLLAHRDFGALNVYTALSYARLDYYDVSQEILSEYLKEHPASPSALNLKACNAFKLADGRAAEAALRPLSEAGGGAALREHPLLRHNGCVFRGGEGALQVLPPLRGVLPEAALNLVIFHLRRGELGEAYALVRDVTPATPQEYILKGIVHTLLGQREGSADHTKQAQQAFQVVGSSPSECDTIPGRQAMASAFYLLRQWDDVLVFLESIKSYFQDDDDFNWNYGIALAAAGKYAEAEGALASVGSQEYRREEAYASWLCRCLTMTGRAPAAWDLASSHVAGGGLRDGGAALLALLANDAYSTGQFAVALKAFDALEQLDPNPAYWEAKQGAAMGVFQAVIAGKETAEALADAAALLEAGPAGGGGGGAAAEVMLRVLRLWADENGIVLD